MAEEIPYTLYTEAIGLLKELIARPSFSREEAATAAALEAFFHSKNIPTERSGHNILVRNKHFNPAKPTLLLNSHHDTVKPNPQYSMDPFLPLEADGKIFGLGSNDAGGALVALVAAFLYFYGADNLGHNLMLAATAEEEISGPGGISSILSQTGPIDAAIVGEPTLMQMAIAERGLMVLDGLATGRAGHAAREEGVNAIQMAMQDIAWLHSYSFPKISELLGKVKMNVTVIETENKAHNTVPATCRFVVDVRVNECYTLEEVLAIIRSGIKSEVKPRSMRLRSSLIEKTHPLVKAGLALGRTCYGSPTSSDKGLMPFPALKMGPGDSARSHTADEFIFKEEIEQGIHLYINLLKQVL